MQFDIIDLTVDEINKLSVAQMKLLRAAQQKKDEMFHKGELEIEQLTDKLYSNGLKNSSLVSAKVKRITEEIEYQCAKIVDNLLFDMSNTKPPEDSGGDDVGGDTGGDSDVGYLVDYSLSYSERYIIVRDFYLAIKDPKVRMAKYAADETAKKYLASYYSALYNVLATYEK